METPLDADQFQAEELAFENVRHPIRDVAHLLGHRHGFFSRLARENHPEGPLHRESLAPNPIHPIGVLIVGIDFLSDCLPVKKR